MKKIIRILPFLLLPFIWGTSFADTSTNRADAAVSVTFNGDALEKCLGFLKYEDNTLKVTTNENADVKCGVTGDADHGFTVSVMPAEEPKADTQHDAEE